ncbi:hypothetical protein ILUMI_21307 [Ignelater luminosus]|uniref:Uncharacterized protein n=1 Tax=Ignelater luminosus TaxID=2038154 RepID=A0A8K0G3Q3_IGNLU|nr:hypothetical protein ILUMI_21307 [Ignelater luminosus]
MLGICNLALAQKKLLDDWKVSLVVPIFKKRDRRDCRNYRGISLLKQVILSRRSNLFDKTIERKRGYVPEEHPLCLHRPGKSL